MNHRLIQSSSRGRYDGLHFTDNLKALLPTGLRSALLHALKTVILLTCPRHQQVSWTLRGMTRTKDMKWAKTAMGMDTSDTNMYVLTPRAKGSHSMSKRTGGIMFNPRTRELGVGNMESICTGDLNDSVHNHQATYYVEFEYMVCCIQRSHWILGLNGRESCKSSATQHEGNNLFLDLPPRLEIPKNNASRLSYKYSSAREFCSS